MLTTLAWLLIGHALADYPLQGEWLSKAKNPRLAPVAGQSIWLGCMACHCAIHAGAVWIVTGLWPLAVLEFVLHFAIDWAKCIGDGALSYNGDQVLHVLCKGFYVSLMIIAGIPCAAICSISTGL